MENLKQATTTEILAHLSQFRRATVDPDDILSMVDVPSPAPVHLVDECAIPDCAVCAINVGTY